jgi:hypothetical protein
MRRGGELTAIHVLALRLNTGAHDLARNSSTRGMTSWGVAASAAAPFRCRSAGLTGDDRSGWRTDRVDCIFVFLFFRSSAMVIWSRARQEGRFAIVTDVERGMRWPRHAAACSMHADERHGADVKSRGPGIPTLMPSRRVMMIPKATVANKPEHRGDREISVKTIAQGMPDVGWTCGDCRLLSCCRRAMGCGQQPGIPCALRLEEGERDQHHSGSMCRENKFSCLDAVIASEAKQSRISARKRLWIASLRSQ